MPDDFRRFAASDPSGRVWEVEFLWQQNAISIRHADTVDVKFELTSGDARVVKVIALLHPYLLDLSRKAARPLSDPWCSRLGALHLKYMIETGEDMDKTVVTPAFEVLEKHHSGMERYATK